jgi:hypothetical protein
VGKTRTLLILLAFFFGVIQAFAQDVKVEGYFTKDSARLGEKVGYVLKATYPSSNNIVFPDSTFNFDPWVLLGKQTFMSHTVEGVTVDSAVYYVSNFSLDPISELALPIFQILKYDSVTLYAMPDQLALKLSIAEIPQELSFQENNEYQAIPKSFDYPMMLMILGVVGLFVIFLLLVFGKGLKRAYKKWQEKRKYRKFLQKWQKAEASFVNSPTMDSADEMLGLWKSYMEHLKSKPFREWTTTEIAEFLENKDIVKDFREIEMVIYAGKKEVNAEKACQNLKVVCEESYAQKMMENNESK